MIISGGAILLALIGILAIELLFLFLYLFDKNYKRRFIYSIVILITLGVSYSLTVGNVVNMKTEENFYDFLASLSIDAYQWGFYSAISTLSVIGLSLFMIEIGNRAKKET